MAIITVLVIIAIPISGFTLNQIALTYKGRRVAATVEDVRALKQADATAFTQPFAAIMRKLPVQDVYAGQDVYPARARPGPGRDRTGSVPRIDGTHRARGRARPWTRWRISEHPAR